MPLNDDRTDKPPSNEVIISKGWNWDWDRFICGLFRKRKTTDVPAPDAVEDCKDHNN
jgi:hypothetical protein